MNRAQEAPKRGSLFVIAAPSGAGKTTLVHAVLNRNPKLRFSVSYTTRPPRQSETDGEDYFFVSKTQFRRMIAEGAFLEYAEVFDNWYGTGKEHVQSLLAGQESVLLEIDWQGARQVRTAAPDAITVFILPPSIVELEQRLRGRRLDSDSTIARRLRDSVSDMSHWNEFDYVIINANVDQATAELAEIVAGRGADNLTRSEPVRLAVQAIIDG